MAAPRTASAGAATSARKPGSPPRLQIELDGATLSVFLLPIIKADFGIQAVLVLMAAAAMVGAGSTLALDEAVDDEELP